MIASSSVLAITVPEPKPTEPVSRTVIRTTVCQGRGLGRGGAVAAEAVRTAGRPPRGPPARSRGGGDRLVVEDGQVAGRLEALAAGELAAVAVDDDEGRDGRDPEPFGQLGVVVDVDRPDREFLLGQCVDDRPHLAAGAAPVGVEVEHRRPSGRPAAGAGAAATRRAAKASRRGAVVMPRGLLLPGCRRGASAGPLCRRLGGAPTRRAARAPWPRANPRASADGRTRGAPDLGTKAGAGKPPGRSRGGTRDVEPHPRRPWPSRGVAPRKEGSVEGSAARRNDRVVPALPWAGPWSSTPPPDLVSGDGARGRIAARTVGAWADLDGRDRCAPVLDRRQSTAAGLFLLGAGGEHQIRYRPIRPGSYPFPEKVFAPGSAWRNRSAWMGRAAPSRLLRIATTSRHSTASPGPASGPGCRCGRSPGRRPPGRAARPGPGRAWRGRAAATRPGRCPCP